MQRWSLSGSRQTCWRKLTGPPRGRVTAKGIRVHRKYRPIQPVGGGGIETASVDVWSFGAWERCWLRPEIASWSSPIGIEMSFAWTAFDVAQATAQMLH